MQGVLGVQTLGKRFTHIVGVRQAADRYMSIPGHERKRLLDSLSQPDSMSQVSE